jgi:uncharacterized protein YbjQ (UPF0145 family)
MKMTMLKLVFAVGALGMLAPSFAADRKTMLPLADGLNAEAKAKLGDSVKFYFGATPTPAVKAKLGSDKTSLKTNAFGKSDEKACHWVFLSAMLQLQKRAKELNANAVVNIVSNYNNVEFSSTTEYECHAGAIMAGVALKGDFVTIAD